jgi:alpha-galactosidase
LQGGAFAVGLFNRGAFTAKVTAHWSDVGCQGSANVRDLWKHKDLGVSAEAFSSDVPSHGVTLLKLEPVR